MKKRVLIIFGMLLLGIPLRAQISGTQISQLQGKWTISHSAVNATHTLYAPAILNKMLTDVQLYSINNILVISGANDYCELPGIERINDSALVYYYIFKNSVDSFFVYIDLKVSSKDELLGEVVSVNGRMNVVLTRKK